MVRVLSTRDAANGQTGGKISRRLFAGSLACGLVGNAATAAVLPSVDVETQRSRIRLADCRGKLVIVNFWATWCGPCRQELIELKRFLAERKDEAAVVALAVDQQGWPAVMPFLQQHGIDLPVGLADKKMLRAFGLRAPLDSVPQTLVFNPDGALALHARSALTARDFNLIAQRLIAPATLLSRRS